MKPKGKKLISDLVGDELDYWVAKALELCGDDWGPPVKQFSTVWNQGGPVMEAYGIGVSQYNNTESKANRWQAIKYQDGMLIGRQRNTCWQFGHTPLVASMRCFVSYKFGEYVDASFEAQELGLCNLGDME